MSEKVFEVITAISTILLAISEVLGVSKCEHNGILHSIINHYKGVEGECVELE